MHILVVDDDPAIVSLLDDALSYAGHRVQCAADGLEALEYLHDPAIQLVVTDWAMPGMDGLELCRRIRQLEHPGYVYTILLTNYPASEHAVEGITAGADDYITKPFNTEELILRIHAAERVLALETRDLTIFAMAKLAESRDPETGEHLERVQQYARTLADYLRREGIFPEIDASYVRLIFETSPLHDIGKVAIPDSVLQKKGKLTVEEFNLMKTHTTAGAETLGALVHQRPNARYLHMARDIAASHHEKYDGSGYPNQLAGPTIPLCGRIVALVDVYDALTSKRVYKDAFSHDDSSEIIREGSGKHFDPQIVEAFEACEPQFIEIRERFCDEHA